MLNEVDMRYLGGKSRIANEISGVINSALYGRKIEDSCGNLRNNSGGKIMAKILYLCFAAVVQ